MSALANFSVLIVLVLTVHGVSNEFGELTLDVSFLVQVGLKVPKRTVPTELKHFIHSNAGAGSLR